MARLPIIILAVIGVIILVAVLSLAGILPGKKISPEPATIEFWGVGDDESVWLPVIDAFSEKNDHLTVIYTRFPEETYEDTLVNRLAEGRGPDVFLLKHEWIQKHKEKLYPLPQQDFNVSWQEVKQLFADGASQDIITSGGDVLGLPLFFDTPALFYNKDAFNASGIATLPKTWDDVVSLSKKITKRSSAGDVTLSGVALGSWRNVSYAFEIISSLMLQNGDPIMRQDQAGRTNVALETGAAEALRFYASFADSRSSNFSWNDRLPPSLDALAEEKTVMSFGFSKDTARIVAKNPHFSLGVAPFPQLPDARTPVVYGSSLVIGVSRASQNPLPAWQFALYAAAGEGNETYLKAAKLPPGRRDLIGKGTDSPVLDIFYRQALIAKSWPVPDAGATRRLFQEAVESILSKVAPPEQATGTLREKLRLLIPFQ